MSAPSLPTLNPGHHAPGTTTRLTVGTYGHSVTARPANRTRHPWLTTATYDPQLKQWTATVEPGFVNAQAPVFRATIKTQKAADNPWGINPLTGKKFFSDDVFNHLQPGPDENVDVPLYLTPNIPLDFRNIGWDGDPKYPVPQFFLTLGAAKPPPRPSLNDVLSGKADPNHTPPPPANLRLLRACDLWLHQPRLALTSTISLQPGAALGISNVTQTLGFASPAPSDTLQLIEGTYVPDTQAPNPLDGDYTEPNFDQILVSTVYLLSPPNFPVGSPLDGQWTPYVRHNLFWNLSWAQPTFRFQPQQADTGIEALGFLGLGTAALAFNFLSAGINDTLSQALNILNANSLAGAFWTCTGGGHDSTVTLATTTPVTAPQLGPNIYTNLAKTLAAQRAKQLSVQLDPPFPYTAQGFPASYLAS